MSLLSVATRDALGLAEGSSVENLFEHLRKSPYDFLDGLIATEQARQSAELSLADKGKYAVHVFLQSGKTQERFCSVSFQGFVDPLLVGLISNNPSSILPTALENLIFWALIDGGLDWQAAWKETPTGSVSDWRAAAANKAVLALPVGMPAEALRSTCAMFGLEHPEIGTPSPMLALFSQTPAISVAVLPDGLNAIQARLISEAGAVYHPKWRCLSLYRILENAYLASIKRTLLTAFDADASRAIEEAGKKIKNEPNQLVSLAEEADLIAEFVLFDIVYEGLLVAGNKFILRLDRGAESESLYKAPERYKKAVIRFYKLRCSIAHAGTSSVIYEQFQDADAAARVLAPAMEAIAIKSLKISV